MKFYSFLVFFFLSPRRSDGSSTESLDVKPLDAIVEIENQVSSQAPTKNKMTVCTVYKVGGSIHPEYKISSSRSGPDIFHCVVENRGPYQVIPLIGDVHGYFTKNELKPDNISGIVELAFPSSSVNESGNLSIDEKEIYIKSSKGMRKLADLSASPKVLVIRVSDGANSPTSSASTLAQRIFTDSLNMKTQFAACSKGKFSPTEATTSSDIVAFVGGVLDIQVSTNLNGASDGTCLSEAIKSIPAGIEYDFRMIVCPEVVDFGELAAVAYVNGKDSWYMNEFATYPHFQMHEIGHNLNMQHSNGMYSEGAQNVLLKDPICSMGSEESPTIDWGKQCFNAAKSYYSGWYSTLEIDPRTTSHNGKLIGVNDYVNDLQTDEHVVVKIKETGTLDIGVPNIGRPAHFVMFHVKEGIVDDMLSEHINQYANKVTVLFQRAGEVDGSYTACSRIQCESYVQSTLSEGESFEYINWDGNSNDLIVKVCSMNQDGEKEVARILIYLSPRESLSCDGLPSPPTPTASPIRTNDPTTTPISRIPTPSPVTSVKCFDNHRKFYWKNGKKRTCKWVEKRISNRCKHTDECPITCRKPGCLCKDKLTFKYKKIQRSCSWVSEIASRCNVRKLRAFCPLTCGLCSN